MTTHTPGPWIVLVDDDTGRPLEIALASDHKKRVAFPTSDGPLKDAHLIAAAPDLLSALTEFLVAMDGVKFACSTQHGDRIVAAHEAARAAIAKAEGRA